MVVSYRFISSKIVNGKRRWVGQRFPQNPPKCPRTRYVDDELSAARAIVTLLRKHGMPEVALKQLSRVSPGQTLAGSRRVVGGGSRSTSTCVGGRMVGRYQREGWIVQVQGMQQGPSQQEKQAASIVADLLGLEISDLLQEHSTSASVAIERFKAAHCVYSGRLPGDVESSRLNLTVSQSMFSDDPVLEVVSLQGKLGP